MAVEAEFYNDNLGQTGSLMGMSNGDFGYFHPIQEQQQQMTLPLVLDQQQGFQFHSMNCNQNGAYSSSYALNGADVATTMTFSQSVDSLLEKQRQELGLFLQIQNERSTKILLHKYEPYLTTLMSQKDEFISAANKKRSILEGYLRNIETEVNTWQVKARESEARVAELNNALSQLRERNNYNGDEESHCDSSQSGDNTCKLCRVRRSCVVFLPCRHLCSCRFCEDFVRVCPVCESAKESCIEVLF